MKLSKFETEVEKKDITEKTERKDIFSKEEVLSEVKFFFHNFSKKYHKPYTEATKKEKDKLFFEEVKMLS